MKILFYPLINLSNITFNQQYCDYMVDLLFHGLKSLLKDDLEESIQLPQWYTDYPNPLELYGNGFTAFCNIERTKASENVKEKIEDGYYEQIIVPIHNNLHMNQDNIEIVKNLSKYSNVKIIDGNDDNRIQMELTAYSKYFKKELINHYNVIIPITLGIPKEKIIDKITPKTKELSHILPLGGGRINWTYQTETDYYNEYRTSVKAITSKKGGWDCMRHYEILANGCIPIFQDLDKCPHETLYNFPKHLCNFSDKDDEDWASELLEYTKNNLTTEKIAAYVL